MVSEILYIRVNKNCNARCFMCDFWKNPKKEITRHQFEDILSKFQSVKMVRFTGGEPLLCNDLPHYIRLCHELGIKTSIITNGLLLNDKLKCLADSGLDQVIVSLDGPAADIHNQIRGVNGLFEKIEEALISIYNEHPDMHTRVNTVVSDSNIRYLSQFIKLLERYHIEQWSIIPIKMDGFVWRDNISACDFQKCYDEFKNAIKHTKIKLLGYSDVWADNIESYWSGETTIHPKRECNLVRKMSFYDPFTDHVYPCNCVPHRSKHFLDTQNERDWYFANGYKYCRGCEPLNAYCSDFPQVIENNIFEI